MPTINRAKRVIIGRDASTNEMLELCLTARKSDVPRRCVRVLASVDRIREGEAMWRTHVMYTDYQCTIETYTPKRITQKEIDDSFTDAVQRDFDIQYKCAVSHYRLLLGDKFEEII